MRTLQEITELLNELDRRIADELEDQDLDFKQWDTKSMDKSVKMLVRTAVCMANGGGGTVVFGVADKSLGRATALQGVPLEVDVNLLKKAVYDQTDPKIMPVYEEMRIPEGTGPVAYHADLSWVATIHRYIGNWFYSHREGLPAIDRHLAAQDIR
jgi:ATP-dependent DNA helicase RecG